jgi:hypothetical protein
LLEARGRARLRQQQRQMSAPDREAIRASV